MSPLADQILGRTSAGGRIRVLNHIDWDSDSRGSRSHSGLLGICRRGKLLDRHVRRWNLGSSGLLLRLLVLNVVNLLNLLMLGSFRWDLRLLNWWALLGDRLLLLLLLLLVVLMLLLSWGFSNRLRSDWLLDRSLLLDCSLNRSLSLLRGAHGRAVFLLGGHVK